MIMSASENVPMRLDAGGWPFGSLLLSCRLMLVSSEPGSITCGVLADPVVSAVMRAPHSKDGTAETFDVEESAAT